MSNQIASKSPHATEKTLFPEIEESLFSYLSEFIDLTDEEKEFITLNNVAKQLQKGTLLIEEGEFTTETYLVVKGCIRTFYIKNGKEFSTEFYTEYQGFTPTSSIEKSPSLLFAECIEDTTLLVSNSDDEQEMLVDNPRFQLLCMKITERAMAQKQTAFDDFKNSTPEERYLNLIQSRPELLQRVPQYQLASYLGITPESLSRIRKRVSQIA